MALRIPSSDQAAAQTARLWELAERLPDDCQLIPMNHGSLLVSPGHAVFCPIPMSQVHHIEELLDGRASLVTLPPHLCGELDRHGFFGPPRPEEPDPPSVQLQLTNACNLACTYCCTNSGQARAKEASLETFKRVVEEARDLFGPTVRIALLGGEPLLVPWALALGEHVLDLGLDLTLFTNGVRLVDEDIARGAASLIRRGAEVRVSLAGLSADTCDTLSGAARFEAALSGLHRLAGHGVRAKVDLMLTPDNLPELAARMHEFRRRLPEDTPIALGLCYLSGREQGEHLFASRADFEQALDRIAFEAGELITAPPRGPVTSRREGCGCALGRHLHLRSDGALFTCFKMEERVGDLAETPFAEAARQVMERPHPASVLPACRDCPLRTLCGGGCRSENLLYTGDANQPVCGPWRIQVICELLAEERIGAVHWPAPHLLAEARKRGIEAPDALVPGRASRHLTEC